MTLEARVRLRLGTLELDVDLAAEAGTVLALLGPNGAGKTTLLRALAGLQPIDAGSITLDGATLDAPDRGVFVPAERRRVGFLFQDYLLFPHLTAHENVAFGLRARAAAGAHRTAAEWLDRVGLADLASARPEALSGGQAQRVALARALATGPALLLLDEPLAALDATTKATIRRELKRHLAGFPGVAVLVTHDPVDATALADRVLIVEEGRVTQAGSIAEITAHPRSRYIADLVGVNLWRGRAEGGSVRVGSAVVRSSSELSGEVFVLVRPRSVSLFLSEPHGSPRNVWRGRATALDATAHGVRVSVDGPVPLVAEITPSGLADLGLAGGEDVWVSFKASEVDVYPA